MRSLVLQHDREPVLVSTTAAPIKKRIIEMPDDDAGLWRVWSVPGDDSLYVPVDITERFALDWAREIEFGGGIEPHDYLAPFPAFIREVAGAELTKRWELWMADHPGSRASGYKRRFDGTVERRST